MSLTGPPEICQSCNQIFIKDGVYELLQAGKLHYERTLGSMLGSAVAGCIMCRNLLLLGYQESSLQGYRYGRPHGQSEYLPDSAQSWKIENICTEDELLQIVCRDQTCVATFTFSGDSRESSWIEVRSSLADDRERARRQKELDEAMRNDAGSPRSGDELSAMIRLPISYFEISTSIGMLIICISYSFMMCEVAHVMCTDDPAAEFISKRPKCLDIGSDRAFAVARDWITDCDESHEGCPELGHSILPTRVIDVLPHKDIDGDPQRIRLRLGAGECAPYVALSYCWGGAQPFTTTSSTLQERLQGFFLSSLPRSLQDAVTATRKLGLRYLFVDALCIIQDSQEDKDREMAIMGEVYQNAYVTISASNARSCYDGFLGVREEKRLLVTIPYRCGAYGIGRATLWPRGHPDRWKYPDVSEQIIEPIQSRCWALQESLKSSRLLLYSQIQLFWRCPSTSKSDGAELSWNAYQHMAKLSGVFRGKDGIFKKATDSEPADGIREGNYQRWRRIVEDYTKRELTVEDDKLPALSSIAAEYHDATGDTYVAGLWLSRLIYDLTWSVKIYNLDLHNWLTSRPRQWRCPSWSWMSMDGALEPQTAHDNTKAQALAKVISCNVIPVSGSAPFGRISHGELKLRGRLRIVQINGSPIDGPNDFSSRNWLMRWTKRGSLTFDVLHFADFYYGENTVRVDTAYGTIAPDKPMWCFLLAASRTSQDHMTDPVGLILVQRADGCYHRIGSFHGVWSSLNWFRRGRQRTITIV